MSQQIGQVVLERRDAADVESKVEFLKSSLNDILNRKNIKRVDHFLENKKHALIAKYEARS